MNDITDPLRVLRELPTTMMWRGAFDATIQYIKNDVVISATNNATYICIDSVALIGEDPSTSSIWFLFTGTVNYIHTLHLEGLTNVGTASTPILKNDGVVGITAGEGVILTGTAQNRVVNDSAIVGFIAGQGILVNGSEITNDGIISIGTGGGLYLETPPPNAKLSQNNILSVTAGAGIQNVGTAQNPILENDWVRSASLVNIMNTGSANDLVLESDSVQTIANTDGSVQISGFLQNREIGCVEVPTQIQICTPSSIVPVGWPVTNTGGGVSAELNFTCISGLMNSSLAGGATAFVTLNLSSICIRVNNGTVANLKGEIFLLDSTTSSSVYIGNVATNAAPSTAYPFDMSFGTYSFTIDLLRAAGMRALTGIQFFPTVAFTQTWSLLAYGPIYGVWTNS